MMSRLFWIATAGLVAICVHLATILYWPGINFERSLQRQVLGAGFNSFVLLAPENQSGLVLTSTPSDIVGICQIDLSKGKVTVEAHVPNRQWTFSVFNMAGEQVYALNDMEAGSDHFSVELSKVKSVLTQMFSKPEPEDAGAIANVGWHAQVTEDRALAVIWMPVDDPLRRKELEQVVKATTCKAN